MFNFIVYALFTVAGLTTGASIAMLLFQVRWGLIATYSASAVAGCAVALYVFISMMMRP